MRRRMPPLTSLATFEAVGRNGSLTLAAEELGVTHSAVSHQIRNLESRMAVPLFLEKGKRLSLTAEGKRLLDTLSGSLDEWQSVIEDFQRRGKGHGLKVATSTAIASASIPEYAAEFIQAHHLDEFTWVPIDQIDDSVDLIISWRDIRMAGDLDVTHIHTNYFMICSPKLMHGSPPPRSLRDLSDHVLLHGDYDQADWRHFLSNLDQGRLQPKANMFLGNTFVAHQAARNGCGIAIGDEIMVDRDLRDGSLICPLPLFVPAPAPIRVITPFHSRNNPIAQGFKSWFIRKVSQLKMDLRINATT
ncbi:LysR family transcriptional regulator [Rhodospirillaceae bacterium KN72]|uniref:LysR family transcriptional regulator n=1 Tax=Pacificispira spongiicola TaxID=2729598 RepID=A0A7Y0E3G5_9PROT|nr:LysR family transcriptional regulator [Pacificispira spongiicola]NMM46534.1 LysR family transcriptional regulator [Pacificispira spongiicola]